MTQPKLSIVIVTMNRCSDVLAGLAALTHQTHTDHEVILVDNASTDGTAAAVTLRFPAVRVVALQANAGVAGGRNHGIEASRGSICVFLDDDVTFAAADALARIDACFATDPELAVVNFPVLNFHSGQPERAAIPRADKRFLDQDYQCAYFCACGFALRRQVTESVGLFWDVLTWGGEELDYSYRLAAQGFRIKHMAGIKVLHAKVLTGRPPGQYVYFNARNRPLIALRSLPLAAVASTTAVWWCFLFFVALRGGTLRPFGRGVWAALGLMARAWRDRQPLPCEILTAYAAQSGRIWF